MYSEELKTICTNKSAISIAKLKDKSYLNKILKETEFLPSNFPIKTRIYCILNNITEIPKCVVCGKQCQPNYEYLKLGFSKYCSSNCSRADKTIDKKSKKFLYDKKWLYDQRINKKKSLEQIGLELGCSEIPVRKAIQELNIPKVRYNESNTEQLLKLRDKNWLIQEYKINKKTQEQIAEEIGSSPSTVSVYIRKHEIESNPCNSYDRKTYRITNPVLEIVEDIKKYFNGSIELNKRSILENRELDIYIPEHKFAIEYNGVYSHLYRPEENTPAKIKGKFYHLDKTERCLEKGIFLLHIWSSLWDTKKEIYKSIIRNKLGYTQNKIYARNCKINEISVYEKNNFLEENHLQGKDKSLIKLGLYHQNLLVSVMTFSKSRYSKQYDWEMTRFSIKKNNIVIGGFSKLLKFFRNKYNGSIVTYADRTYSCGDLYNKNGFELIHVNAPSYYYVLKNTETLIYRSNLTKKKLLKKHPNLNPNWTEDEITRHLNYNKIWDCGTLTFLLK